MVVPVVRDRPTGKPVDRMRSLPVAPEILALAGLTLLGALLRFVTLAHQSYWVDEALTVHETHLSFGAFLHQLRVTETTPPVYFVLAWLWVKVFGSAEFALRSISALAGVAIIPIAYFCGRELVSRATGLLAAAFAAVSPFLIWYSQEARAYMLFATFCGLSWLFFIRLYRHRGARDLMLWALCSALALATHFFAVFLVGPEALWVLWRLRSRPAYAALGAVGAVQLALLPLLVNDSGHALGWIKAFPLSIRIKQVAVDFGLSTLYQSQAVTYGLAGVALLAVLVTGLLVTGGGPRRRRAAALAAVLAACVVLVPILLAALGRDYLVPRNLIAGWLPLAVLLAAACTAPRTLPIGVALAVLVLGAFVYAGLRIDSDAQYQRPDWRGVARALGSTGSTRAIVAYDASYATLPLSLYLPRVPWTQGVSGPVSVSEVDVVANAYSVPAARPPAGVRRLSTATVGGFLVVRYALSPGWRLTPASIGQRASALVPGGTAALAVLIQPGPA
jgi:mannosyltransferase